MSVTSFPYAIEGTTNAGTTNAGDGMPLTLGEPDTIADFFSPNALHSLAVIGNRWLVPPPALTPPPAHTHVTHTHTS